MRGDLTVVEAAHALGTSPQTIRTMLRKGELQGSKRPWGSRFVWAVSAQGLDDFLAEFGRLDGSRRKPRAPVALSATETAVRRDSSTTEPVTDPAAARDGWTADRSADEAAAHDEPTPRPRVHAESDRPEPDRRPFILRPRGRATVMVGVLGVPLVVAKVVAQTLPSALWFRELGQGEVFGRMLAAKVEFRLIVVAAVALFMAVHLVVACRGVSPVYRKAVLLGVVAASLVAGGMFGTAVAGHWQTFLLWRHRQPFGFVDPVHGRDVGYFVFSLPFEVLVCQVLLGLVMVTTISVALVYAGQGKLRWRTRHATFDAQLHLAVMAALFLLALAWRIRLQTYVLELAQSSPRDPDSFSGADYVDVHARMPALDLLSILTVVLAVAFLAAPLVARRHGRRQAQVLVGVPSLLLVAATVVVGVAAPALVQRYVVDPNPLLREQPYLEQSIAGTRRGLGLDTVGVQPYQPTNSFDAADFAQLTPRLSRVQTWDSDLLGARMRQLVTDTPYFKPEDQSLDVVRVDGQRQPTVVSARELDLDAVRGKGGNWINDRLAYTHGLGLIRFSGTETGQDRGPRLLDPALGVSQPRIYFGNLVGATSADEADTSGTTTPGPAVSLAGDSWVLVNTRRPEVDATSASTSPAPPYHYTGSAGIALSSWLRRATFALALDSKQLLLSRDITPASRILLHRDVHDRLEALAPFIHWDANAVPLTMNGHVIFVVDGYTTSSSYPYAEQVDLGGTGVNYARPSILATVDAFSGTVKLYLTDTEDPIARAWDAAFPSLFLPMDAMPHELTDRLRYPAELFDAQATAYERFHITDPGVFTSDSDVWSRPIALSGPIEVAGDVDFDESDEDDLRLTMRPGYTFSSPPGQPDPTLLLSTYYVPNRGQNLVASLNGWIDEQGHPQLAEVSLPRVPVTLGPAQISRLVFATPRVSNLLGLRNLEIRDVDKSSLDSVILGRPHLLFLPGGVMQIQSLYEGSRGPGAARLLGVTAYINGRAGLGPDVDSAVRQALNQPPQVKVQPPGEQATVGTKVTIQFQVQNGQRETVTVTSPNGRVRARRQVVTGVGSFSWVPAVPGPAHVQVTVLGLDGTEVSDSTQVSVLGRPPSVQLLRAPGSAVVGEPVRVLFRIFESHSATASVSTNAGIVFSRTYDLPDGNGLVEWTPEAAGMATIEVRVRGHQQHATATLRLRVDPAQTTAAPPPVELIHVPKHPTVGSPGVFVLRASGCSTATAQITGPSEDSPTWSFPCPARRAEFAWTPSVPGEYLLTTTASVEGGPTTSQTVPITVAPASGPGLSPTPSPTPSPRRSPIPEITTSP